MLPTEKNRNSVVKYERKLCVFPFTSNRRNDMRHLFLMYLDNTISEQNTKNNKN